MLKHNELMMQKQFVVQIDQLKKYTDIKKKYRLDLNSNTSKTEKTNGIGTHYYTIIDFNEVDIRIYLSEKVIIHRGRYAITVLLYDFSTKNENGLLSLLTLRSTFNLRTF